MTEEFKKYYKWFKTFDRKILNYYDDSFYSGMKPVRDTMVLEDGIYLTIRSGLGGIYTALDEWKDGQFQLRVLDASKVIAFRPLTDEEKEQETKLKII